MTIASSRADTIDPALGTFDISVQKIFEIGVRLEARELLGNERMGHQGLREKPDRQELIGLAAAAWSALVASILADHGGLDLVHLNAGVMSRPGGAPLLDDPLDWFTVEGFAKVSSVILAVSCPASSPR